MKMKAITNNTHARAEKGHVGPTPPNIQNNEVIKQM